VDRLGQLVFQGLHGRPPHVAESQLVDSDGREIARGSGTSPARLWRVPSDTPGEPVLFRRISLGLADTTARKRANSASMFCAPAGDRRRARDGAGQR